ncbi:TolC family protein [Candidatus Methylocalor cossyra]|uniref:Heavy metal RND efflux outer membrane protein, CzcC family n=1 Tax=Candidatus Methylocalor cossyra TaxID=3108543 RepID=A0ABM9NER1_9GAMM
MKRYLTLLVLVALWLGNLTALLAGDIPLSEDQVLALFYERNLDLIAAHYQIDRAEALEWLAAAIPNPQLTLGWNELNGAWNFNPRLGHPGVGFNVAVSQLLETAGKRGLRMESSRLGRAAVEADFKDALRTLSNAVRHAYYRLLLAQKTLEVARDNHRRYQDLVAANRLRLKAGDIAESDLLRVEVESYKAQAELDRAAAELKQARADLARLLAWPEQSLNLVATETWPTEASGYLTEQESALVEKAYAARPDLKSALLRTDQAEKDLELARRLSVPDVTLSAGYVKDPGNVVLDSGTLSISVPLPIFYRYKGEIGQAVANLNQARLQVEQIKQAIRGEVVTAYAALQSAAAIAARFETEVTRRLEKVRQAAEFAYAKGAASLLELLDAERSYKTMMLDYYAALTERTLAYADLLKALGEEPRK